MPMKVTAGLSKKMGLPAYGSLGASCALEIELEQGLLFHDEAGFRSRLAALYDVCRSAVEEESLKARAVAEPLLAAPDPGHYDPPVTNGPCAAPPGSSRIPLATERQINFAQHLARQIRALGGQRLAELAQQAYGRSLDELTSPEASQLIELLKELRAGTKSVNDLLPGAAALGARPAHGGRAGQGRGSDRLSLAVATRDLCNAGTPSRR
jgi:hypothetical protein